jgi:hypothetical protein
MCMYRSKNLLDHFVGEGQNFVRDCETRPVAKTIGIVVVAFLATTAELRLPCDPPAHLASPFLIFVETLGHALCNGARYCSVT